MLRHAAARRVSLVLQRSADQVVAVIEDDGVGFTAESVTPSTREDRRLGLIGMRERMALVGGTVTVESAPGRGTTVIARVPIVADKRSKRNKMIDAGAFKQLPGNLSRTRIARTIASILAGITEVWDHRNHSRSPSRIWTRFMSMKECAAPSAR